MTIWLHFVCPERNSPVLESINASGRLHYLPKQSEQLEGEIYIHTVLKLG